MNADLERVIALQQLDSATQDAQRRLAEEPARLKAFDARLESARAAVAAAKERLAENLTARRGHEEGVGGHTGRAPRGPGTAKAGEYDGRCAEFCGLDHWRMYFSVRVVPADEFERWLDEQRSDGGAG